jgi:hypothetical protein
MDDVRIRTLATLLELSRRVDNTGCWDRIEELLRDHDSQDELAMRVRTARSSS